MQKHKISSTKMPVSSYTTEQGYDPEMLFVECAKCGNPIIWEKGRSTEILQGAGIDPLELDAQCLLVTDGCPRCSKGKLYHVQVYRVQSSTDDVGATSVGRSGHA